MIIQLNRNFKVMWQEDMILGLVVYLRHLKKLKMTHVRTREVYQEFFCIFQNYSLLMSFPYVIGTVPKQDTILISVHMYRYLFACNHCH